ncbi:hypothetical protein GW17_00024090 [Ensete ventricosum]|nr:hypothetical protein GW17_00024090 [Ensete ventricosum]
MLVNEAVEAGASRSAIKPENHRILGGVSLGDHKVVEELPPMVFIYMIRWERSVESWQVSDASILGGRRGQVEATAEEHQPQLESTSARGEMENLKSSRCRQDDEMLKLFQDVEALHTELKLTSARAIAKYKVSQGFKRFRAKYSNPSVEEDSFVDYPEDANVQMEGNQPFNDSVSPED